MARIRDHQLWLKKYHQLMMYAREHGHSLVPRSYVTLDGFRLGIWVSEQRKRKEHHSSAEVAKLEALPGWRWDATHWQSVRLGQR
jgi:hypothetical protein